MPERRADSHTSAQELLGLLPPFPTLGDQLRNKRDAESSEDELIEDNGQGQISIMKTGSSTDAEGEIINADAYPDRKRYLDELRKCIKAKGQAAHDKRRKLDPTNSGDSPSAINGNVEHASEDIVHERIKGERAASKFQKGNQI